MKAETVGFLLSSKQGMEDRWRYGQKKDVRSGYHHHRLREISRRTLHACVPGWFPEYLSNSWPVSMGHSSTGRAWNRGSSRNIRMGINPGNSLETVLKYLAGVTVKTSQCSRGQKPWSVQPVYEEKNLDMLSTSGKWLTPVVLVRKCGSSQRYRPTTSSTEDNMLASI